MLEPEAALAEVDFARDAGLDHPLQRAIDGGAADAMVLLADQIDEVVCAEVSLLAQKHLHDHIAFAGSLAARGAQAVDVGGSGIGLHEATRRAAGRAIILFPARVDPDFWSDFLARFSGPMFEPDARTPVRARR